MNSTKELQLDTGVRSSVESLAEVGWMQKTAIEVLGVLN